MEDLLQCLLPLDLQLLDSLEPPGLLAPLADCSHHTTITTTELTQIIPVSWIFLLALNCLVWQVSDSTLWTLPLPGNQFMIASNKNSFITCTFSAPSLHQHPTPLLMELMTPRPRDLNLIEKVSKVIIVEHSIQDYNSSTSLQLSK